MKVSFVTIFPESVKGFIKGLSLTRRAIKNQKIDFQIINIRDFATDKHKQVDDYIFGRKKGMLLKFDVVYSALEFAKRSLSNPYIILPSPRGRVLNKYVVSDLSKMDEFIFLCPNYEGVDGRILRFINEEISIGDYVISSGELASLVILEAIIRYKFRKGDQPLVKEENVFDDSFNFMGMDFLLEPSQYTRPREVMVNNNIIKAEEYLFSGNHNKINRESLKQAIEITIYKRPDLYKYFFNKYSSKVDKKIIFDAIMNSINPS